MVLVTIILFWPAWWAFVLLVAWLC